MDGYDAIVESIRSSAHCDPLLVVRMTSDDFRGLRVEADGHPFKIKILPSEPVTPEERKKIMKKQIKYNIKNLKKEIKEEEYKLKSLED